MNNFIKLNLIDETAKKYPYSKEELECLAELAKMSYDEIDLSDIPETTPEEWERVKIRRMQKKKLQLAS